MLLVRERVAVPPLQMKKNSAREENCPLSYLAPAPLIRLKRKRRRNKLYQNNEPCLSAPDRTRPPPPFSARKAKLYGKFNSLAFLTPPGNWWRRNTVLVDVDVNAIDAPVALTCTCLKRRHY